MRRPAVRPLPPLLALLALPSLVLSGCAGPGTDPAGTGPGGPAVITDPGDTDYLRDGTAGAHIHDYWQGRDEVVVVDNTTGNRNISYGGDHGPMASWIPPDGSIVPQGTGELEAVVDWTETSGPASFPQEYTHGELWVRTAADGETRPVGRIEPGVPLRFPSTNAQDDPPHYVLSLWEFEVVLWNEGAASTSFSGRFSLRVTAFRTLELEPFPPHPDLWGGAAEKELHAFDEQVQLHAGLVGTYACLAGCADRTFRPDDGVVVPFDAAEVLVVVTTDTASTPVAFALEAHGADTRSMAAVAASSNTLGRQEFRIPVDGKGDSPYARQSLWEFRVHPSTPREAGPWSGTYHVTATALRGP